MSATKPQGAAGPADRGRAPAPDVSSASPLVRAMLSATSEMLRLISAHPGDLTRVLHGILAKAAEICGGEAGSITMGEGTSLRYVASHGPAMEPYVGTTAPALPDASLFAVSPTGVWHADDFAATVRGIAYLEEVARVARVHSYAAVPLTREGVNVGALHMYRHEVRPFTDDELAALGAFAEQASLAIVNAKLFSDLDQSLLRQQAMADVLDAVSTARVDLQPVFERIVAHAGRLCDSEGALIVVREGDGVRLAAQSGRRDGIAWEHGALDDTSASGESILTGRVVAIADWGARPADQYPLSPVARSHDGEVLAVPMLRDGAALGALSFTRPKRGGYTDAEIALLQTFANQAAIAIGNARLLREIEQRNGDLDESLKLQTATSEVLALISAHPGDLIAVMNGLIDRAVRLCDADAGIVCRFDGDSITFLANPQHPESVGLSRRAAPALKAPLSAGETIRVDDLSAISVPERPVPDDVRSFLAVGLRVDGELYGMLGVNRHEVRPFNEREANILDAFGEQASIAIGNARLFNDLDAALALQTAMAEVLRLISEHPGELTKVLQGILTQARELCDADRGQVILIRDDETAIVAADASPSGSLVGRVLPGRNGGTAPFGPLVKQFYDIDRPTMVDDVQSLYAADDHSVVAEFARAAQNRSRMVVPLLRQGKHIGNIHLARGEVRPFTPAQATILQAFADQAVIAVTNAGLFNDLAESLARQEAMTELLDAVSTARTDLTPVFDVLARHADRLCGGTGAVVATRQGDGLVVVAAAGALAVRGGFFATQVTDRGVMPIDDSTMFGASAGHREIVHIRNWDDEPADRYPDAPSRRAGAKCALTIPMVRDDVALGVVAFSRDVPGGYSDAEVSLLKTFVEQATVAVDNARLLVEIEQRNSELAESLELQTATGAILELISANPGDLRKVFEGIVAQAARLCDADSAGINRVEGDDLVLMATSYEHHQARVGRRLPIPPEPDWLTTLHFIDDLAAVLNVPAEIHSCLSVPLIVDNMPYGTLALTRSEVRPFEPRHGRIAQVFAEQAAIAIGNAKLFNDLDESLARQRAMTDVLDAVSTARFDLQPVFDRIAEHASRLCDSSSSVVALRHGDKVQLASAKFSGLPTRELSELDDTSVNGATILSGKAITVDDWDNRPADQFPTSPVPRTTGIEVASLPMLRDGVAVGSIGVTRPMRGGYTGAEVSLLQTFANQAAIAVENARLLSEIEQRNAELAESLELQTATSEILALISAHPGDLTAVLDGLIERAVRLCDADAGVVLRLDGDVTTFLANPAHPESVGSSRPIGAERKARLSAGETFCVDDLRATPMPGPEVPEDVRSYLAVGLRIDGRLYGMLGVNRHEVRPFDEREARILNAFGEQAAIAIGNAKLFNDLDESLARQRAMTDVLDAVSTARFDLQPVFDRIVEHASRLCGQQYAQLGRTAARQPDTVRGLSGSCRRHEARMGVGRSRRRLVERRHDPLREGDHRR